MINENELKELRTIVKTYINNYCIFRCNPDEQYMSGIPRGTIPGSTPGTYMKWQFLPRRLTHNTDMMASISMLMEHQFMENNESLQSLQLAGLETSSQPLISFFQAFIRNKGYYYDSFSVRKERKSYGIFNFIDGIPNKFPVVVMDDIINSASSVNRVLETCLYEYDLDPHSNSYFIINFNRNRTHMFFNGYPIKINSLFFSDEFDFTYSEEKYWIPDDCQKFSSFRPDYM